MFDVFKVEFMCALATVIDSAAKLLDSKGIFAVILTFLFILSTIVMSHNIALQAELLGNKLDDIKNLLEQNIVQQLAGDLMNDEQT